MTNQPDDQIETTELNENTLEDVAGGGPGGNVVVEQKDTGSSTTL